MKSLFLFFLVFVVAVHTAHAALVSSPTFPVISVQDITVAFNGKLTVQHVATFNLNENILSGTIHIDNRSVVMTCDPPATLYSYALTAKVPQMVVPHSNEVCRSLNPEGFNATKEAQIQRILATPFGYANRQLFFFEPIGIAALVIAMHAWDIASTLKHDYEDFKNNEFEPWRNQTQLWMANTDKRLNATDDALNLLSTGFSILKNHDQQITQILDGYSVEVPALSQKIAALTNNTISLFNQVQGDLNDLRTNTQTALQSQAQAIQDALSYVFTSIEGVLNGTKADNSRNNDRILGVQDSIERSLSLVWDAINEKRTIIAMTQLFYTDLSRLQAGRRAMVGAERLPPADPSTFQPADRRILIEKVYANYIRRQNTGGPDFGEIVNTEIAFFTDTSYALDNFGPGLGIETLIRRMGPAFCNRSFTALDSNGHILPELPDRGGGNLTCRLWVEVRTRFCQAKNQAFNWSQADGPNRLSQTGILNPLNCTANTINGLLNREQVFSDYVAFQRWFAATICNANLWTVFGQAREFQLIWAYMNRVGYTQQPLDPNICFSDLTTQANAVTPYFMMLQGIEAGLPAFLPANINAKTQLVRGQLPAGLQCLKDPVPYMPIRRDANGNLINDGNSIVGGCTRCYWLEASEELVNVYSVAQFATQPTLTNCVFSVYQKSPGQTTDYLVDAGTITARITFTSPFRLPDDGLWYGDFDDPSKPLYDVPQREASVDSSPYSRKNTVGSMAFSSQLTVLPTYEDFIEVNGGFWSPFDGAVSVASYAFQRGIASDGFPFCVVGGGVPINESIFAYVPSYTEPAPDAFVAQSIMCNTLKRYRVSKINRGGQFVLAMSPRVFDMPVTVTIPSGFYTVAVSSFCPTFELRATGGLGFELALFNARSEAITIVLTLRTNITSEIPFCTKDDTVVVPGAPASVFIYKVPHCLGLNITVQRQALDPDTNTVVLATCDGSPITASSLLSAARAYTGLPADVSSRITITDTNTGFVDKQSLYSFLSSLQAKNDELNLFGFQTGDAVTASIAARLAQLNALQFNTSLATIPAFFSNPINLNFTDITNTQLGLIEIGARINNISQTWAAGGGLRANESALLDSIAAELEVNRIERARLAAISEALLINITQIPVVAVREVSSSLGIDGFEGAFSALVRGPVAAVEALSFVGKGALGFISAVGDGIKGVLSSAFGIISTIIQAVICCVIVGAALIGIYFLGIKPLKTRVAELEKRLGIVPPQSRPAPPFSPSPSPADTAAAAAAAAAAKTANQERAPLLAPTTTTTPITKTGGAVSAAIASRPMTTTTAPTAAPPIPPRTAAKMGDFRLRLTGTASPQHGGSDWEYDDGGEHDL